MAAARSRSHIVRRTARALLVAVLLPGAFVASATAGTPWPNYGRSPQHTATAVVPSQSLAQILWQTPVDLNPQYSGNDLLIHYGTPLTTPTNTVLVPVKTGATDGFRIEAHDGYYGTLLWSYDSDYSLPPHNWTPSFSGTVTPDGRLYIPGAGGTLLTTTNLDAAGPHAFNRVVFYGLASYLSNPASYNATVQICTPLTSDSQGNIYYGIRESGSNPSGLTSGLVRVAPDGSGSYVPATTATGGLANAILFNCAPALSNDESELYVAMRGVNSSPGYLVALAASTLATVNQVLLIDPHSLNQARLLNDGTASPMVAPDGRVFFGVLESPSLSNADRGWLLQFDANLNPLGNPGAFGWDDTPSLVPASCVPSYSGSSPYLLMCKYNFYAGIGGDGTNKLAIVDPRNSQTDAFTGTTVMKEVLTILGVTPDSDYTATYPGAVREWCINTAAVDTFTQSVLAGSEDGVLYRWNLATNSFSENITLTPGVGEAYTPTVVAPDGKVYAINNATLFAVGAGPVSAPEPHPAAGFGLAEPRPQPFSGRATLPFSLPSSGRATVDILDLAGRRVARVLDQDLPAGAHAAVWDGHDASRAPAPAGVYFARLAFAGRSSLRRIVLVR